MKERLPEINRHESMRGYFAYELHEAMRQDEKIWLVTADLGYGMMDHLKRDYPDRFINSGAAEQLGMGISVGLAREGKTAVFYSITNFAVYRPFEVIRNYVDYEQVPVKIIGGGRDRDYTHDGISHWSEDAKQVITTSFPNIKQYWPEDKEEMKELVHDMLYNEKPSFVSLKR